MISEEKAEIHLTYEDIIPYLPPDPPEVKDPEVLIFMRKWKEKTQRKYLERVNMLYDQFQAIWPSGTPIDYYIAYVHFSSISEEELFEKLQSSKTIKEILQIVSSKKNKSDHNNQNKKTETNDDDNKSFDKNTNTTNKKSSKWKEDEISLFIKLLSEKNDFKTWKNVSRHFKNKTKEDCFLLYQKLQQKGQLSSKYIPKKDVTLLKEQKFDEIKGLFLEFNDCHAIVGPQLEARKDMAKDSPLYGYSDLITGERMFLPTMSEYGTVLDYSSWIKIISDTHLDPYEFKPIRNVRQITIITNKNYPEIQSLIKHVGDKK